jgi:malate dehydrogenase (oxaloacetate-decarboxylating)(NADP+)
VNGHTFYPSQGNNVYIFPSVGLAVLATEPEHVTDDMFLCAAETLASLVNDEMVDQGIIYPPVSDIREVETKLAVAVATYIFDNNLTMIERPADIDAFVRSKMYYPDYGHSNGKLH